VKMLEHDLKADTYDNAKHAVLVFMQSSSQMYCYMCRPARKGSADLKDHDTLQKRLEAVLKLISPVNASGREQLQHFCKHVVLACMQDNTMCTQVRRA
jgi:hypothetical protein